MARTRRPTPDAIGTNTEQTIEMLAQSMRLPYILLAIIALSLAAAGQDLTRELNVGAGGTIDIVNRYGRVAAKAEADVGETPVVGRLTASSPKGVPESAIKMSGKSGHVEVIVGPANKQERIDLVLILPERMNIRVETLAGEVEIGGNFASIDVKTDTGTVAVDVPDDDLKYQFVWTESKPRYLADFEIAEAKEKAAGRFEIKGRRREAAEVQSSKFKVRSSKPEEDETESSPAGSVSSEDAPAEGSEISDPKSQTSKTKGQRSKAKDQRSISLNFTTARGIILLNVPPSEVMSDLRERPLTNAAKAIIRSGDSMLMEAIRRASPKYFGDYARTLPPFKREPAFAEKGEQTDGRRAPVKTATVRVTDINNRAVAGLTANDFEVLENGQPRDILSVERSTAPFNLVLLLDVSGSVENYVNFIRKAARSFVNTVAPDDRVSLIIFNDDVKVLSKFTTDKGRLSESLDTFDAGGGTAYYDALAYTVADTLRPLKGERTAIVILTDGDDNRSFLSFESLLGSIQESGALIYPIYVPSGLIAAAASSITGDIDPLRSKYMSLSVKTEGEGERLAKVSGGVYYPVKQISDIQRAYEDIVGQLRSAYSITYRSDTAVIGGKGANPHLRIRPRRDNVFATVTSIVAASEK